MESAAAARTLPKWSWRARLALPLIGDLRADVLREGSVPDHSFCFFAPASDGMAPREHLAFHRHNPADCNGVETGLTAHPAGSLLAGGRRMKNDQFIDAVQTVGIVTIAIVLSYLGVRFEGMLSRLADRLKRVLIHQDEIIETTDRIRRRIETIEAVLDSNKAAIAALSNRLSGKRHEGSSVEH
jgi:hypothetical protein